MRIIVLIIGFILLNVASAFAGDPKLTLEANKKAIELVQTHADYVWTLLAAALVFFMQAGLRNLALLILQNMEAMPIRILKFHLMAVY